MENELTHWGVKGMRWGIRRYQNKDGSLTPAGKKRYDAEMSKLKAEEKVLKNKQKTKAKLDKLDAKRKDVEALRKGQTPPSAKKSDAPKKPSVKEMSDQELFDTVRRLNLEKQYRDLNPKQVSRGQKFVTDMVDKAVVPAIQEVAKGVIKNGLESVIKDAQKKNNQK